MTALDQAILDNENLVYFAVNKYFPALLHDDDIIQLGRIGLWKALRSYDPNSSKFGNYAVVCIKNEINHCLQGQNRKKRKPPTLVYLDATMDDAPDKSTVHEVILGTTDIDFLDADAIRAVLTKEQLNYLSLLLSGYCVADIARLVGTSKQNISMKVRRIREIIFREVIADD